MLLKDVLTILVRRWFVIVGCALLVVTGAVVLTMRTTPVYEASARVFLSTPGGSYMLTSEDMNTFAELVRSPVVLDPLKETLGLPPDAGVSVSARMSGGTAMMDIYSTADDPQVAADLANGVGPQLVEVGGPFARLGEEGAVVEIIPVAPASPPGSPSSPNLTMNVIVALLAGMGLGVGIILLQTFLDTKIRNETDLRAFSKLPLLARLRKLRQSEKEGLVLQNMPFSPASEEFRRLRTNVQFIDVTAGGQHSLQITSAMPGDGKSMTAANLALAMTEGGAKVLLVDCDLRRPAIAGLLGIEGSVGLTTLLLGQADLDTVAQRWRDTTLYVLPAGIVPPNPSELIGSHAMEELFSSFAGKFDFIIVDAPPVNPVIDPVLISRLVGGTLMVVRVDRTGKRELAQALRSLATVGKEVSGVALNGVQDTFGSYSHYYPKGGEEKSVSRASSKKASKRAAKAAQRR